MQTRHIRLASGLQLEYVDRGPADGLPVVFLHGVTDSWRSFEALLDSLPPHLRAIALSVRGHGGSDRPASGYLFGDMSEDLVALLDALGLDRVVLVGHSMGASVAQRVAVDHQDRLLGLVLIGSFASLYRDPGLTSFFESAIAPLTDPLDRTFAREWQLSTLARELPPEQLDVYVDESLKVPARVWKATFAGFLETPDFAEQLRNVRVPTLLVWGDRDTYASRAAQARLLALLPDVRLVAFHAHGHAVHWEDPAGVAEEIASFIAARVPDTALAPA